MGADAPGCLVEAVTLTNYEDEDYVLLGYEEIGNAIHLGIDKFVENQSK